MKDTSQTDTDSQNSERFGYSRTMSPLQRHYWKNRSHDVYKYCGGYSTRQPNKDRLFKSLKYSQPLELHTARCGPVSKSFITHPPVTKSGRDCHTTFVDRFQKRVHVFSSEKPDTAMELADCFLTQLFQFHRLPNSAVLGRDSKIYLRVSV